MKPRPEKGPKNGPVNGVESGQVTVLVVGMAMIVFAVVGLATDGTRAFLYRRTLQSAADAAALAGAGEIDSSSYYSSRGRVVELDPAAARRVAARWLALRSLDVHSSVTAGPARVEVILRGEVPTLFLRLIGLARVPVAVQAASAPARRP